ncbi:hypothetical protein CF98_36240 [Halopseudomonas bauzanensis]|nr:hypothetical protein CF98_36240 [Halopseudomonas bauzanensis]
MQRHASGEAREDHRAEPDVVEHRIQRQAIMVDADTQRKGVDREQKEYRPGGDQPLEVLDQDGRGA